MKLLTPVVWSEGMHLSPHHFQAQSRYVQDSIGFASSALWTSNYGLIGYELSAEALDNGQIVLVHARGVFPDGLAFQMPGSDPLPAPRSIGDAFGPTENRLTVYLSVPPSHPDGRNCALDVKDSDDTRFIAESRIVHDETTGRDDKPIRLGRKNITFAFSTEQDENAVRLPIARVMRSGTGRYIFDPEFIPPCLDISASPRLMSMLGRLISVLQDKSQTLALAAGEQAAFSLQELTRFWFLHVVNTGLTPLQHLFYARRGHPEVLFVEMLRLGGALCTFTLDTHPRGLPVYNHDALERCFDDLDTHIRRHIEIVLPTSCLKIKLQADGENFYFGEVTDQRSLGASTWVFAIRGGSGDANVMSRVPVLVKICSRAFVPQLVKRALPGFELQHMPVPPSAIPVRPDVQYFLISKAGPCWEHIVKTREVGVYVPGEFPDAEVELLVVVDPG